MKKVIVKKALALLGMAILLIGFGLSSCDKDDIQMDVNQEQTVLYESECPGGGEIEDPIEQGTLKSLDGPVIADGMVYLYAVGNNTPLAYQVTDENGNFCFQVEVGNYYHTSSASGFLPDTTAAIYIDRDTSTLIELIPQ